MTERLFNGQIQPQARPMSAFLQPVQKNIQAATQPTQLQVGRGLVTQQQAGTSSVAGFNQMQQLAEALGPFSKQLNSVVNKGFRQYAISSIESGYYDELKNEQLRAKLRMQENQEAGASQAADTITTLTKVDPIAASLARESNPWKLIGRRRAVAQLAAGEVSARFNAVLAQNAGQLATMAPGSEALMRLKAETTSKVLSDFGLSGDELEAAYYVAPQINKSWDKFTQKQSELYSAEVYRSSTALTAATVKTGLSTMMTEGITLPSGEKIMPGDPRFGPAAGVALTTLIDKGLSLLGGEDKTKALEMVRKNLAVLYNSGTPGAREAIGEIRLGSATMEMDKRPRWIDANPFELQDFSNKALNSQNDAYEQNQKLLKGIAEQRWNEKVAGLSVDSPEYQKATKEFEEWLVKNGYRDPAGFVRGRMEDDRRVAEGNGGIEPITEQERIDFDDSLRTLTPADFESVESTNAVYARARRFAGREPTRELREEARKKYEKIIAEAQARFAGLPRNSAMRSAVNNAVKVDLGQEGVVSLRGTTTWQNGMWGSRTGQAPTAKEQRYRQFGDTVRALHTQEYWKRLQAWRNANPGVPVDPATDSMIQQESFAAVRESADYKKALNKALGKKEDGTTPAPPPNQDPKKGPVPRAAASSLTPEQAKSYVDKPVMSGSWVYGELTALSQDQGKKGVSEELAGLAKTAGVDPYRYLLEQLKFYAPTLDPTGQARRWLENELKQKKSNSTPAASYGDQSSSRAPGGWLNAMVMPSNESNPYWNGESLLTSVQAQTARLPGGLSGPAQGPYTPVNRRGNSFMPDGREPRSFQQGPQPIIGPMDVPQIIKPIPPLDEEYREGGFTGV